MREMSSELWFANWHSESTHEFIRCAPVFSLQTEFQRIDIVDTERFGRVLLLDGEIQTASRYDAYIHESLCQPALLLHPQPQAVLIVGGGDGGSLRQVLKHTTVSTVHLVEIDGEVIKTCKEFLPGVEQLFSDPRVEVILADGRRFLEDAPSLYHVIIVDMSDPKGPARAIFTYTFCELAKAALSPRGILTTHCESPDSAGDVFYRIIATYRAVFEKVYPYRVWIPPYSDFWGRLLVSSWANPKDLTEDDILRLIEKRNIELQWLAPELFIAMFRSFSKDITSAMMQDWSLLNEEGPVHFRRP